MNIGDRVAYSAQFCRSIGAIAGPIPHARGTIKSFNVIGGRRFANVHWDNHTPSPQNLVFVGNLAIVGPNSRFCQC